MSPERTVRRTAVAVLAAVGVLVLVGCTQEPVDPAAVARWSAARAAAVRDDEDVLVVLSADVGAGRSEEPDRRSVGSTFAGPAEIDALEFSCFGDGTMSTQVELQSHGSTVTYGAEPMQCGAAPQRLRVPVRWRHEVDRVAFGGGDSTADSAWQLTVRGSGGGAG